MIWEIRNGEATTKRPQESVTGPFTLTNKLSGGPSWLFGNSLYREFKSESATAFFPVQTSFLGLSDYRL